MRRCEFITTIAGAAAAWPSAARAQQSGRTPKIGWLKIQDRQDTPGQLQAFRDGIRALGLLEGGPCRRLTLR
jgi:putative ABC transport system substrate-binding protein